ncbi:MAG: hypothetical protein DBX97_03100 [Collinsella tanakaei]|nr:MAG: hypothetical protein DBX97_03100 [Collinsella tanakaei]
MSISLFKHNEEAYIAAMEMLSDAGKAAIVHPTGTGKSFIGFKLCEDHSQSTVCWLSPSEYIFKTQIENLKATGAEEPKNIRFYTYAKFMLMSGEEIAEIKPDYIILDEFHRCGAEMWGQGVQRLLSAYPAVPTLGMSATAVRYLDNQRNMANELFEGNIASEMTLGEAIVRGILTPPKYVVAVYGYQKSLNAYQRKIQKHKNVAIQRKAEEYLEKLRRSLENADGVDRIFEKHIAEKNGKYILFVPNSETMQSVKAKCREWFAPIDKDVRVYTAYSDDPETSKAFADFKADNSAHLKILLAINMLNEGVHVDGVSGVILFRPTISPIIYKQQIGRALSAGKGTTPLILDVVANVYNLFSIDSFNGEIAETVQRFKERGNEDKIVFGGFTIYDEVKDCRELFAALEDTLSSSWEEMYGRFRGYVKQFGHADVPANYKTADGIALGNWCQYQRKIRRGLSNGLLTAERIAKLDALGFVWSPNDEAWQTGFRHAESYAKNHADLNVPSKYVTPDGFALGSWIRTNRSAMQNKTLSEDKIRKLQNIGMIWDVKEFEWMANYRACRDYYLTHGKKRVPKEYVAPCGRKAGEWLRRIVQRHVHKTKGYPPLRDDQVKLLREIGECFICENDLKWTAAWKAAEEYEKVHGNLNVPSSYVAPNGVRLYKWLEYQRRSFAGLTHSKVTPEQKAKLDKLHFDWSLKVCKDTWQEYFDELRRYTETHGGEAPTQRYVGGNGLRVGSWLANQKRKYRAGKLPKRQEEQLKSVGINFEDTNEKLWINGYRRAAEYYNANKNLAVSAVYKTQDGYPLGEWVRTQVKSEKAGRLPRERKTLMERIGVVWK